MSQAPSIGRIVHYKLSSQDADTVNRRRNDAKQHASVTHDPAAAFDRTGNSASAGEVYPMVVVRLWGDGTSINGQVLLDGNDTLWVTSRTCGDAAGQWAWPPRV